AASRAFSSVIIHFLDFGAAAAGSAGCSEHFAKIKVNENLGPRFILIRREIVRSAADYSPQHRVRERDPCAARASPHYLRLTFDSAALIQFELNGSLHLAAVRRRLIYAGAALNLAAQRVHLAL